MKEKIKKGDRVILVSPKDLIEVFHFRNFFSVKNRQETASILGGRIGTVASVEDKYAFDYFNFQPDDIDGMWTIPYQAINMNVIKNPLTPMNITNEELIAYCELMQSHSSLNKSEQATFKILLSRFKHLSEAPPQPSVEDIVEAVKGITHNFNRPECDISEDELRTALTTLFEKT